MVGLSRARPGCRAGGGGSERRRRLRGFHLADWGVGGRQVRAEPRPLLPSAALFSRVGPCLGPFPEPGFLFSPCPALHGLAQHKTGGVHPWGAVMRRAGRRSANSSCPFYRFGSLDPETGYNLSGGSKIVQGRAQTGTQVPPPPLPVHRTVTTPPHSEVKPSAGFCDCNFRSCNWILSSGSQVVWAHA